jgi:hypothetical protein
LPAKSAAAVCGIPDFLTDRPKRKRLVAYAASLVAVAGFRILERQPVKRALIALR